MSRRHSSWMFIVTLVIAGTIYLQMGLYIVSKLAGWDVRLNLVAVCHSAIKSIGLTSLKYVLDAVVIYSVLFFIWKISSQFFNAARMKKRFERYREKMLSCEMNKKYSEGKDTFIVISNPTPVAVTMGFIHPRIVLSTGLMQLLNEDELEAVIYHEIYHKENHDPLKVFLMSLCSSMMWYIPILKWNHQKYKIVKELLADQHAIEKQQSSVNLGSALLKMLKVGKQENMDFAYVSFADTSVNYRIHHILEPLSDFPLKLPFKVAVVSFYIFSLICALFIYALY
jgi:beta-lactamase regulating signal transducer with metallopeptidase domain